MLLANNYSYLFSIKTWNLEMGKNEPQSGEWSIDIGRENNSEEILEPASDCCIYRVPQFIRNINEDAYTPKLISIGPLHYGRQELMGMEEQKRRYWTKFGERVSVRKLEEFETYIKIQEKHICDHYSVSSKFSSSKYVSIILYDAVFIIELLVRNFELSPEDFLLDKSQLKTYIMLDLLLLENQLPYFVLNDLYSLAFPSGRGNPSFFTLSLNFFQSMTMFNWSFSEQPQPKHFTDFLRRAVVMEAQPPMLQPNKETSKLLSGEILDLPSATKLNESGLRFKGTKGKCLLDISMVKTKRRKWLPWFEVNEVQIPRIEIYDETECLLRNLMVLEVFHYPTQTYVCNYADLMDYLINTAEDVDLLAEKEIIGNCVGDNEAIAKMFNTLCSRITPSESCFHGIADKMKTHYDNRWNLAKATLRRVYFNNVWTGNATIAASLLLILTAIQAICSIIQVLQEAIKNKH
ncbi:hypothetical protein Ddye_018248 [Dipteronia dyeriana]|uniref:Uncharacterized protein n=1 Tax=Dipteronia dyeriana TaxID=168575 RepID=A0AAD9X0K6_9ROSI|nr:hypothetical protein Ddye_018248 [Dipteronia dyeriana]